jgi:putative Mg2+ transporter-C (MgtC) family protein
MTSSGELLIRLVVGTVLGGVIGYERDVHGRPAGFRTHLIVALAATTSCWYRRTSSTSSTTARTIS